MNILPVFGSREMQPAKVITYNFSICSKNSPWIISQRCSLKSCRNPSKLTSWSVLSSPLAKLLIRLKLVSKTLLFKFSVMTFVEAIVEKNFRCTLSLTAARGRVSFLNKGEIGLNWFKCCCCCLVRLLEYICVCSFTRKLKNLL